DGLKHDFKQFSLQRLALAYDVEVNVGRAIGISREVVSVTRRPAPGVGVCRSEHNVIGVGPIIMQALPDAARSFRDVRIRAAEVMHLKVIVRAVAEQLSTAGPEIRESGDVLLGR